MAIATKERTRVWTIEDMAGPANEPAYQKSMKGGTPTQGFGDITRIEAPNPSRYGAFITVGETKGARDRATMDVVGRYSLSELSLLLRLANKGCKLDVQMHMGRCQNPAIFNSGWDKVFVLEDAAIVTWATQDELGALESGEQGPVNEMVSISADKLSEAKTLRFEEQGAALVVGEIVGIVVCDEIQCGDCGIASDGCQKVFAISVSSATSPAGANDVLYTDDGGTTWAARTIDIWTNLQDPTGIACVNGNVVIISNVACAIAYIDQDDLLNGAGSWVQVTTGLTCPAGAPNAIYAVDANNAWVVGNGGYIYFMSDPANGVTLQDAGVATTQNLNDVHAYDDRNVVAVGNLNAVVYTTDGGDTWSSVTGPAAGVNLNAVYARKADEWFIGTATGRLYYTRDSGVNWTEKSFPGSGAGSIRDVQFSKVHPWVGYLAHNTAAPAGRLLRTIDGGFSWYRLPETGAAIIAHDYLNEIALCGDPNIVYGGGLHDNGSDGIIVKGA